MDKIKCKEDNRLSFHCFFTDKIKKGGMEERLNIWFDEEGDFLEIGLEKRFFQRYW